MKPSDRRDAIALAAESSSRPRICHIITKGAPMGGSQIDLLNAARHESRTFDVEVITGSGGPLPDACRSAGIPVTVVPMVNSTWAVLSDVVALARLVGHLRRSRPHLVRTHASKAGVIGRVAAWMARVPVVVHTLVTPSIHGRQTPSMRLAIWLLEWICGRFTDHYVSVSRTLAEDFVRSGICSNGRITVVPSGIDLESLRRSPSRSREELLSELDVDPSAKVVISVAELQPAKGHELAIEGIRRLAAARDDIILLIVGPGSQYDFLRSTISRSGLVGRVVLTGPRQDVPDLLAASDLFLQTSWREGVSRSLAEALYAGLPAVATDVGGTRELVIHGETGLLVPPGDVDALVTALRRLIEDEDFRAHMSRRARQTVGSDRTVVAVNQRLGDLYRGLLRSIPSNQLLPFLTLGESCAGREEQKA